MQKTFHHILLESGLITAAQLQDALVAIAGTNTSLARYLVDHYGVSAQKLAQVYAEYASLPIIDQITEKMADVVTLAKIPLKFLRDHEIIPLFIDGHLTIASADPTQFQAMDEINLLLGGNARYVVTTAKNILDAINRYYPLEGAKQAIAELEEASEGEQEVQFEGIEEKDILSMAAEAPIIKLVNNILFQAAKRGASDIHIEPFEKELSVRYRIDGVLYPAMMPPKRIQNALVSRIKIMANLNIAEKRVPQDGRIDLKVAGRAIDIRVSILPVIFGERVVMRLLDKTRSFGALKELGISDRDYATLMDCIHQPNGIIFVTGPTGSGKTTTLYSVLSELNKPDVNIVTVEDPVEYQMSGIGQVAVKDKIGLTFAAALRSILRQDPDIVMIGETRDTETAQIAIQAALTGHLVLSTLHTNNAPATITRLIDMGVEPYLIASSIILAIAQRLVRKLCTACKVPYKPTAESLQSIGLAPNAPGTYFKAVGCAECLETGYRGRLPIFEFMRITNEIARLTVVKADTLLLRKQAIADGMTTLLEDGARKVQAGITSVEEVLAVATLEQEEGSVVEA